MASESDRRLLDLVDQALAVDPQHRAGWLEKTCGTNAQLRAEIEALLAFDDEADGLLNVGPTPDIRQLSVPLSTEEQPVTATEREWLEGTQLGDYRIEQRIGAGGMGVVYRAKQLSLNRTVALKVLPANLRVMPKVLARFRREVEAAARLHHDNIVAVHTTGDEQDIAYYAMELIDGPPLSQVIAELRRDPLPELRSSPPPANQADEAPNQEEGDLPAWVSPLLAPQASGIVAMDAIANSPTPTRSGGNYFETIARLLAGVADGLAYAHDRDVVHRDIKPSNLLLSPDGRLHISDFGLARMLAEPGVTQTGEFVGTPYYMAPEQINPTQGEVDGRTDVYALGATLYELLTLRPPIPGDTRDEVLSSIVTFEPTGPRRMNKRVPRDLETICLKAIEKEPDRRYQSASAMADDLRRFVSHLPITAKRSGPLARAAKWCRRHPSVAASIALAICLATATVVLGYRAYRAHHQRALAAARATHFEAELQSAQIAIDQAKKDQQARIFQDALLAAMQGDLQSARAFVDQAEQVGASPGRLHVLRGQIDMFSADFEDALVELMSAVQLMPNNLAAHLLIAETYARVGNWELSLEWLGKVKAIEPSSVEDHVLKGRMELYFDAEAAEATLDEAIALDRRNIVARLIRGSIRAERTYQTAEPTHAERALEDLRLAGSFLEDTSYLLSRFLNAHLIAATAYETTNRTEESEIHLSQAGTIANRLATFAGDYEAHRWRAYYFDHVGDLAQAVTEWRAIDDKTIGFLIMTLYRAGRFDEALAACDEYGATATTGTAEFCHAFVLAATCSHVDELVADFPFGKNFANLSVDAEMRRAHILWCLAGQPERAIETVRQVGATDPPHGQIASRYAYMRGDLSADEYLQRAANSRYEQARARFVIGIRQLGRGQREIARAHFQQAVDYRFDFNFFTAMSRALLAQFDRDPHWPTWIVATTAGESE